MAILYARKLFHQKGVEKLDKYNKVNSFEILHFLIVVQSKMERKIVLVVFLVVVIIAEQTDARRKKRLCRFRPKTNTCVDILEKQHRRLPRVCRVNIPGQCQAKGGKCVQRLRRDGRKRCACVEFHDM